MVGADGSTKLWRQNSHLLTAFTTESLKEYRKFALEDAQGKRMKLGKTQLNQNGFFLFFAQLFHIFNVAATLSTSSRSANEISNKKRLPLNG